MVRRAARPSRTVSLHLRRLSMATETPYVSWRRRPAMFEEFSKRNKAVRAALELAAEGGWSAVTFAAIAERTRAESCRSSPRLHLQDGPAQGVSKRGRWRGPRQGETRRRSRAGPARPRVRHDHDALRGDGAVQASASPHLSRSLLPSGGSRADPAIVARLAILDACRRRRQARWSWCWPSRRGSCVDLRQGVSRLARR